MLLLVFIYPICIPGHVPSFGAAIADRRLCLSGKRTAAMLPDSFKAASESVGAGVFSSVSSACLWSAIRNTGFVLKYKNHFSYA